VWARDQQTSAWTSEKMNAKTRSEAGQDCHHCACCSCDDHLTGLAACSACCSLSRCLSASSSPSRPPCQHRSPLCHARVAWPCHALCCGRSCFACHCHDRLRGCDLGLCLDLCRGLDHARVHDLCRALGFGRAPSVCFCRFECAHFCHSMKLCDHVLCCCRVVCDGRPCWALCEWIAGVEHRATGLAAARVR